MSTYKIMYVHVYIHTHVHTWGLVMYYPLYIILWCALMYVATASLVDLRMLMGLLITDREKQA